MNKYVKEINKEFELLNAKSKEDPNIKEYKSILETDPGNLDVIFQLAALQFEINLYEEAIANCLDVNFEKISVYEYLMA